jgi:PRC-barrel domain
MTSAIEDVRALPGKKVLDQMGQTIGKIKEIYADGGDGEPTWVTVEAQGGGLGAKQTVFIPLARLKQEDDKLGVPYSADHIENAPEIESTDELSAEDERRLRDHYGIDRGDQELRSDNKSYATLAPEEEGAASRAPDTDKLETPDADKRDEETEKRVHDPGSSEIRHVTFEDSSDD